MSTNLINTPDSVEKRRLAFGVEDDFLSYSDGDLWTKLSADGGSVGATSAAGGVLALVTGSTDNDEVAVATTNEIFKIASGKTIEAQALVQFTEANTDDANVLVGLADAIGANTLLDGGGGPKASYSGACFYKVDGGTKWVVESSIGGTQSTNTTNVTAGGSAYQHLRIQIVPVNSTEADVFFWIDGIQCRDSTTSDLIAHRITYTGATEMDFGVVVKAGGGNAETVNVDYLTCYQTR